MTRRVGSFQRHRSGILALFFGLLLCFGTTATAQPGPEQRVAASDGQNWDGFGRAVAIDGNVAVVGAPNHDLPGMNDAGAAYVFHYADGTWTEVQKLTAGDDEGAFDEFGFSVTIDRGLIAVGAPLDDDVSGDAGAVYLFEWDGSSWVEIERFLPDGPASGHQFGFSVSIGASVPDQGVTPEQTNLAVGAPFADNGDGLVYFWVRSNPTWTQLGPFQDSDDDPSEHGETGTSVALRGDSLVMGAPDQDEPVPNQNVGVVYVRNRSSIINSWPEGPRVEPGTPTSGMRFGAAVATGKMFGSEYVVVVGAPGSSATSDGSVTVLQSVGTPEEVFTVAGAHRYGIAVAIDGQQIAIGAQGDDTSAQNGGAVYFLTRDGAGDWGPNGTIVASDPDVDKEFGASVAYRGSSLIVGSPSFNSVPRPGAAYLYSSGLFNDGFESGDTSVWSAVVP